MFTFPKSERLCSKALINRVFTEGTPITRHPVKMIYLKTGLEPGTNIQVLFTIPKKNIRKASHRNLIRRRMREAYRLNRHLLTGMLDEKNISVAVVLIYLGKSEVPFSGLQLKISWIFQRLSETDEMAAQ